MDAENILDVDGLSVDLQAPAGSVRAVDAIRLGIAAGETVCLVGESGSGKTVTALSIMRLIDYKGGTLSEGEIRLDGRNLAALSQREMSDLRGRRIGIVFQEPMTALDPVFSIGAQIIEVLIRHRKLSRAAARLEAIALLKRVHIPDAHLRVDQHPHQLSGGMRQRAMIAMALACEPELLIADEPTTALDVTIQAQILKLLRELQAETGMAILLITHDLGIAAEMADRVVVMYAGRVAEDAPVADLFARPAHPYTRGLLQSVVGARLPRGDRLHSIRGAIPDLAHLPEGCRFHPRCPRASRQCQIVAPPLQVLGDGHVACWHPHADPLPAPIVRDHAAEPEQPERKRLVEVVELHKHYSLGTGWPGARRPMVRRRWRVVPYRRRRDVRAGRQIRLRQIDAGTRAVAARARQQRAGPVRRPRPDAARSRQPAAGAAAYADGVPGPLRLDRSALDGWKNHRRAAGRARTVFRPAAAPARR